MEETATRAATAAVNHFVASRQYRTTSSSNLFTRDTGREKKRRINDTSTSNRDIPKKNTTRNEDEGDSSLRRTSPVKAISKSRIPDNEPVSPSQLGGRHSNPIVTTPMIVLDFSGTTHQSASHNVAFNQVINQSFNQAQDISPGMANLKPSLTGHNNSARRTLTHKLTLTEERSGKISQKASNEQALRVSSNPRFQSPNWYQSVEKLKRSSAPPIESIPLYFLLNDDVTADRGTLTHKLTLTEERSGKDFTESVERTGSSRFLKSTVPVSKLVSIGRETQEEFSATNYHSKQRRDMAAIDERVLQ
ncbi:hypothetical protein F511_34063 [Dorcoceras hygrometricum]|uniref:Uncharacterized protein n=1 Tax=Dorcoceras hygrometricum TaxID=472368 RepID=A0A2Z7CVN3_9LAMI|nr:hypothetical protein F511_34063 [Dorcoceras hygrometricum]